MPPCIFHLRQDVHIQVSCLNKTVVVTTSMNHSSSQLKPTPTDSTSVYLCDCGSYAQMRVATAVPSEMDAD